MDSLVWVVHTKDIDEYGVEQIGVWEVREDAVRDIREKLLREAEKDEESYEDWLDQAIEESNEEEVDQVIEEEVDEEDENASEDVTIEDTPARRTQYRDETEAHLKTTMEGWNPGFITEKIPAKKGAKSGKVVPARTIEKPKKLEFNWGILTYKLTKYLSIAPNSPCFSWINSQENFLPNQICNRPPIPISPIPIGMADRRYISRLISPWRKRTPFWRMLHPYTRTIPPR